MSDMNVRQRLAKMTYAICRAHAVATGNDDVPAWEDATEWEQYLASEMCSCAMSNPKASPKGLHNYWLLRMNAEGWQWGPALDHERKQHPKMIPFEGLSENQRIRYALLHAAAQAGPELQGFRTHYFGKLADRPEFNQGGD